MAYPVLASSSQYNGTTSSTQHTITLPTGITEGDLLIGAVSFSSSSATVVGTLFYSSQEWQSLGYYSASTSHGAMLVWRIAGAGDNTLIVVPTSSQTVVGTVLRITGGDFPEGGYVSASTANSTQASVTTAAVGRDHLWLAIRCGDSTGAPTGIPTGYTSVLNFAGTASNIAVAQKNGTNSESPGAWTSTALANTTFTVGVYARPYFAGTIADPTSPTPVAAVRQIYLLDRDTGDRAITHTALLPSYYDPGVSAADGTFNYKVPANTNGYSLVFQAIEPGFQDIFVSSVTPTYA